MSNRWRNKLCFVRYIEIMDVLFFDVLALPSIHKNEIAFKKMKSGKYNKSD